MVTPKKTHWLDVPGFAWFFTSSDAFEPDAGPFRITSHLTPSLVGIAPLDNRYVRRFVPISRLELRRLIYLVSN